MKLHSKHLKQSDLVACQNQEGKLRNELRGVKTRFLEGPILARKLNLNGVNGIKTNYYYLLTLHSKPHRTSKKHSWKTLQLRVFFSAPLFHMSVCVHSE